MYFLIEETNYYESYDLPDINVIDYSENKEYLEEKAKRFTDLYQQELKFVKDEVEPFIEKYKIQLESEWKIYCIPYKYPKSPSHEDHNKFKVSFTKEFLERNKNEKKILKYLHVDEDILYDRIKLMSRHYEIKKLKQSVNEYTLSYDL